jgi:outer membrane lipoprotein carrier protein
MKGLPLILAASFLAAAGAPASDRVASDPLVHALQEKLDHLGALKGRFMQSLDSRSLGRPRAEEGRFFIKKPAMMRWEYEKPEAKLAITDGATTWLYLPEDREAHRGSFADLEGGGAVALLLAGRMRLDRDFTSRRLTGAELEEAGPAGAAGASVLELKPVKATEEFERLIVSVDPERLQIRRLCLVDPVGDRMVFELYDLTENPVLSDTLFHFDVPPGVEVVEDH